jgi:hypothetical protein
MNLNNLKYIMSREPHDFHYFIDVNNCKGWPSVAQKKISFSPLLFYQDKSWIFQLGQIDMESIFPIIEPLIALYRCHLHTNHLDQLIFDSQIECLEPIDFASPRSKHNQFW